MFVVVGVVPFTDPNLGVSVDGSAACWRAAQLMQSDYHIEFSLRLLLLLLLFFLYGLFALMITLDSVEDMAVAVGVGLSGVLLSPLLPAVLPLQLPLMVVVDAAEGGCCGDGDG